MKEPGWPPVRARNPFAPPANFPTYPQSICLSEVKLTSFLAIPSRVAARLSILAHGQELSCRVGSCQDPILRCGAVSTLKWRALRGKWLRGQSGFPNYHLALIVVFHILQEVGVERKVYVYLFSQDTCTTLVSMIILRYVR